jgi:hypothetical protein
MASKLAIRTGIAMVLAGLSLLNAQIAGRISGTVVDQTGSAIPGAQVSVLLSGGAAAVLTTETNAEGLFTIPSIRPDTYDITVQRSGFTKTVLNSVKVNPSGETTLPAIKMEVAAASQTVEVTDTLAAVQTGTFEVAQTVTQAQVENLPVLDRQVSNLFATQAGVGSNGRSVTVINGLRPSYANVLLDGINIQDVVRTNSLDYIPNKLTIGQVAELTVSSSNSNSTIGGNATTISLSTPSGTNEYHGNAYWYNRNSKFGANDWFNNKNSVDRPFLNLNQLGGSIGGPIIKDKLLFFANYEAYRQRQSSPITNTIPTAEARQGNLRFRDANGVVQSYNVLKPFSLSIDPFIQKMLSDMPQTGNTNDVGDGLNTTGYAFNARSNNTRDNVTGKVDYYLSSKNAFSGSYIYNRDIVDRPDVGFFFTSVPPIFNDNHSNFMSASWRWNPRPTLTNELRGGFNISPGTFKTTLPDPKFYVLNTSLLWTSPYNEYRPEGRTVKAYSIQDNANWIKGRHSLSFGIQANIWRNPSDGYLGTIPSYTIGYSVDSPYGFNVGDIPGADATFTGTANNLLASLAGIVSGAQQTFNVKDRTSGFVPGAPALQNMQMSNLAPYITDTWKVNRRLTLVAGIRWEYFSPVNERDSLTIQPRVASGNPVEALLGNATLDFAGSSVGRPLYKKDLNNFAPNFGFAWDVFGDGRTSVRGGYSIAFANDNNINTVYNVGSVNNGLFSTISLGDLNAMVSKNLPAVPTPKFQLPTTSKAQFDLSPDSPPVQGLMSPDLATPYVQQWNLGIEREWQGFVFSGRYVANHAVKQFRLIDFNQINVKQGGFLDDFKRAQKNGFLALAAGRGFDPRYNANIAGSQRLPFFDKIEGGGYLTNSAVTGPLRRGEVGSLGQLYQANFLFPDDSFSYFPNPYTLYSALLTNLSNSTYHSAQLEVRKRTRNGMQVQANYVFSKALSDASLTRGLEALLDNGNPRVERAPTPYDQTHAFKVNHYIPLPFGAGHRLHFGNSVLNRAVGGWGVSGFLTVQNGPPVSILSARGTLNRGARSGSNTVDTTQNLEQLKAASGLFMTGNGPYFINPANIGSDGRGVAPDGSAPFAGQIFFNPQAGSIGSLQRRNLTGPWFKSYNMALLKDTKLTERQSIQLRADFYNLFNNPNFYTADVNVNNANFGKFTQQFYSGDGVGPRVIQFGLFYRF